MNKLLYLIYFVLIVLILVLINKLTCKTCNKNQSIIQKIASSCQDLKKFTLPSSEDKIIDDSANSMHTYQANGIYNVTPAIENSTLNDGNVFKCYNDIHLNRKCLWLKDVN